MLHRPHLYSTIILRLLPGLFFLFLTLPTPSTAKQRQQLIVTHDSNYEPLVYINEQGLPQGYLIDFWKHFGEVNNIDIRFKLGDWQKTLDWVRTGQADVHGGLFFTQKRNEYLKFGEPIIHLSAAIYIAKGMNWDDMKQFPVGVVAGGYTEHFMHHSWPNHPVQTFPQASDMVKAAVDGEIKAFVADQPIAVFYLRKFKAQANFLKYEDAYKNTLRIAVANGRDDLRSLIQNGWKKLDTKRLNYIRSKWFLELESDKGWALTGMLMVAVVMFVGLLCRILGRRYTPPKE